MVVPPRELLAPMPSVKATLRQGSDAQALESATGTLAGMGVADGAPGAVELDETVLHDPATGTLGPMASIDGTSARRTTVLPRRRKPETMAAEAAERSRFDRVRALGQGAMGEVELARDNDIRRTVALKRLRGDVSSEAALLRFADEVRIVGQLEHPSIVPIYDVGRDESGRLYLVMKHLHGQTMEIIQRLRSGDRETCEKYTVSHRVHLFLGVLDAIRYAHARGVIHRDLKPANIMIGPYGEVTVLDWGIAKPLRKSDGSQAVEPLERTAVDSADARLQETRLGSLAGTPLYMSPEQAAGRNDDVDERSDAYTLCVVMYEWLALEHPLSKKATVTEVLASIITHDYEDAELRDPAFANGVPMEWVQLCARGLKRDRSARFQSVAELEAAVNAILAGRVPVRCHVTLGKRTAHELAHWIDRHPGAYSLLLLAAVLGIVGGLVYGVVGLVRALL